MPRYREPIIVKVDKENSAAWRGTNKARGTKVARVLKALDIVDIDLVDIPTVPGPTSNRDAPGTYADGWLAWWPEPPLSTRSGAYEIPDPPTIDMTVSPTDELPILWEASCEVGTNVWTKRIVGFYARVEWKPVSATEVIRNMVEINANNAKLKMRPGILDVVDVNPSLWNITRVGDNSTWQIENLIPSFRRGEFIEMIVKNVVKQ